MKKNLEKIIILILFLLFLPILILGLLIYTLVYTPYDYIRYKSSAYYKDQRRRYRWLFAKSNCFKIYNSIKEHGLPIEYVEESESNFGQGYFFYRDVLIVYDESLVFDDGQGSWTVSREDKGENEYINLSDAIQSEIVQFNSLFKDIDVNNGVILCDISEIETNGIANPDECKLLFTYRDNDLPAALERLIEGVDNQVF